MVGNDKQFHRFDVELDELGYGEVKMDGIPLRGVRDFSFVSPLGKGAIVTLTMIAGCEIRSVARVECEEEVAED